MGQRTFIVTMGDKTADGGSYTVTDLARNVLANDSHMFVDVKVTELPQHAAGTMIAVHMPRKWWLRVAAIINAVDDPQPAMARLREAIKREASNDVDRVLGELADNLKSDGGDKPRLP